jgi:uncharacterized membrane protein YqgA involved in biofilm formation
MLATLVNAAAVIAGSLLGLLLRGRLRDAYRTAIQTGAGILTLVVGIQMAMKSSMIVALALALIVGGLLGEWWRIEDGILRLGDNLRRAFRVGARDAVGADGSDGARNFAYGFLNASLLFCVGAMAIVGSFKAGTEGDYTLIFTKSVLDGAMAVVFTAAQGIGVAFSALSVLVYQGALTLLAGVVKPFVTDALIAEITGIGGALLLMIGINLLGIARLKTANFLPSIVLMVAFVILAPLLPGF